MSLGASGPPATPKQLQYLAALLAKNGHATFRDARRPLGLTQRQGAGKFTRREASDLIDRLLADDGDADSTAGRDDVAVTAVTCAPATDRADVVDVALGDVGADLVRGLPADVLADELRRRGWTVGEPRP